MLEGLNLRYQELVYITGDDANTGLDILKNSGRKELFNYLKGFSGTGDGKVQTTSNADNKDQRFRINDYIIFFNSDLGYIGVERVFSSQ